MTADTWILGLDGGGSKTALAYLGPGGQVSGPYTAPGINPFDRPGWAADLTAFLAAHPAPGPLAHATLGLPGYGESPAITAQQDEVCRSVLGVPHSTMNDVQAAFVGAFPDGVGALLLAGTGSMAWASDGARHVRAGGWGDGFGDEGSAYWIGRAALSLASQALDGRHPDAAFAQDLLCPLLGGKVTPERLLEWHHGLAHVRSGVATVARTVDQLAATGQATALALLQSAAHELARHVHAVRAQLDAPSLPWSYAGSVTASRPLRDALVRELACEPTAPALPPLGGALYHAATRAGHEPAWALAVLSSALSTDTSMTQRSVPRAQEHV
ncbi:N-acetylglucosamine kinase [Deinococcus metalli]|uniref:N-acetylglucosamine kinase n=1 Tax=Deinococcus metalli TaxID=1141878 RepID=A0A7W8NR07_9DEIO|nr:BadF/BadG/BcrA/BcrD ATPase family protein [Deinococcus metalli]MBB5375637.1 N-acetylglucosamine kinase [Deinococcus metalli]GHF38183.1 N-acetylglucosamine kinase [Deinococcus metalli]